MNYPPYGQPPQGYAQPPMMGAPVPFSATLLWLIGILKLLGGVLLGLLGGAFMVFASEVLPNGRNHTGWDGLFALLVGMGAVALVCVGVPVLLSGVFDTIAGNLARKGRSLGRTLSIVSCVLSLLSSLAIVMSMFGSYAERSDGGPVLTGTGLFIPAVAIRLYIFISMLQNSQSFPN
ncbi:MAG: hypothetical protein Q8Q09_20335 [Deltaproteobacteria bacterium]|nr:hypothetical protein [Deltaproteobacteria bacterium]